LQIKNATTTTTAAKTTVLGRINKETNKEVKKAPKGTKVINKFSLLGFDSSDDSD